MLFGKGQMRLHGQQMAVASRANAAILLVILIFRWLS
jgi:hypothetical protein